VAVDGGQDQAVVLEWVVPEQQRLGVGGVCVIKAAQRDRVARVNVGVEREDCVIQRGALAWLDALRRPVAL
jgi:hypothetical protein